MKYSIMFLLIPFVLISQDIIDPEPILTPDLNNYSVLEKEKSEFVLGWNWGSIGKKLDDALFMNSYHAFPFSTNLVGDNMSLMQSFLDSAHRVISGRVHNTIFNSQSVYYEPTIFVNPDNNFEPMARNENGAVFGFQNKKLIKKQDDISDEDFGKIYLLKDSLPVNTKEVVLSDVWPKNVLKYYQYSKTMSNFYDNVYLEDDINGKELFVSINLKSLEPISNTHPDSVVLTIKLPYKLWSDTTDGGKYIDSNYVKFSNLPMVSDSIENDTVHIYGARGDWRGVRRDTATGLSSTPGTREFQIIAEMLDVDGNGTVDSNITLSSFISFSDSVNQFNEYFWNPLLEPDWWYHPDLPVHIRDLDIEVTYHGNLDIAIDWIRLETPRARKIFDGYYDDSVKAEVQYMLNKVANHDKNPKLHRIYISDELNKQQWGVNRYLNMLLDTLGSTEFSVIHNPSALFGHSIAIKEIWNGDNISFRSRTATPYISWGAMRNIEYLENGQIKTKYNQLLPQYNHFESGYKGTYHGLENSNGTLVTEYPFWVHEDTLNSDYESQLISHSNPEINLPLSADNWLFDSLYGQSEKPYEPISTLFNIEKEYYHVYKANPKMLFNSTWWANLWVQSENWDFFPSINSRALVRDGIRPKTGEEIRLMAFSPVLLGAKGLLYWFKSYQNGESFLGLQHTKDSLVQPGLPEGEALVYSSEIGGDFKQHPTDPNFLIAQVDTSRFRLDHFGHKGSRYYIGLQSTRVELYKHHKWINLVSDELLDLRLQAWHAKGYKEWDEWNQYNSFKNWVNTPLDRIVYLDSVRTRKLFQPDWDSRHNYDPDYEHRDSSFFDLTLLQHEKDSPTDLFNRKKSFYLGLQNRRTDPLIYRDSNFYQPGGNPPPPWGRDFRGELMFFSSAEMDSNVRFGGEDLWGNNMSADWWQEKWWQRLGIRELSIPINIPVYGNGTYLVAEELGVASMDTLGWWYADSLYHRIDTSLANGDKLIAKLLPGQGKIVKMSYIPYFFNDPTKDTIPDNDSCYFCDIYNDFDLFDFEVEKISGEFEECCYDISITYNGNCVFEDIPFRLLFEGESGNTFLQNMPSGVLIDSLGTNIKFTNFEFDLDSTIGTIDLGTYCISDSSNEYTISLLAGKDKGTRFIGCDREMQFKVECDGTEEVKDCCENLTVTDSMYTNGGWLNGQYTVYEYCTIWEVDQAFDSDCIYGVTLGDGDVVRDLLPSNGSPIDFTQPALPVLSFCTDLPPCPGDTSSSDIKMTKLRFLGKDGTTVCEVDVPIWLPCSSLGLDDLLIGGPTPKSINEKDKEVKSYKFDNLSLNLWPNPAQNELNLEINSKLSGIANISLINNLGQSVNLYQSYSLSQGLNNLNINLTDVRQGVYYIQILKDGSKVTVPFVITK